MFTRLSVFATAFLLGSSTQLRAEPITIVTLGDSITKGVRPGVKDEQTFASLLGADLKKQAVDAVVINVGIGGERTDGALSRLEKDVLARKPKLVLMMYGTNDSYVDKGKQDSRLTVEDYRKNLLSLVEKVRGTGAEVILMTEPRWALDAKNGIGENPNIRLEKYVDACREVAKEKKVPIVDHYTHWTNAETSGAKIRDWTTDGCHPNPKGHREMADLILPVVIQMVKPAKKQ